MFRLLHFIFTDDSVPLYFHFSIEEFLRTREMDMVLDPTYIIRVFEVKSAHIVIILKFSSIVIVDIQNIDFLKDSKDTFSSTCNGNISLSVKSIFLKI